MAILQASRPGRQLILINPAGSITLQAPLRYRISDLAFVGQQIVGLDEPNSQLLREPDETLLYSAPQKLDWPTILLSGREETVAIIELGIARLRLAHLRTGISSMSQLTAPEIQGILRPMSTADKVSHIIAEATMNRAGELFCTVSPYNVDTGAIVLKFGEDGTLAKRLRLELPVLDELKGKGNPDGHMVPMFMGVVGNRLFTASSVGHRCAYYDVPR